MGTWWSWLQGWQEDSYQAWCSRSAALLCYGLCQRQTTWNSQPSTAAMGGGLWMVHTDMIGGSIIWCFKLSLSLNRSSLRMVLRLSKCSTTSIQLFSKNPYYSGALWSSSRHPLLAVAHSMVSPRGFSLKILLPVHRQHLRTSSRSAETLSVTIRSATCVLAAEFSVRTQGKLEKEATTRRIAYQYVLWWWTSVNLSYHISYHIFGIFLKFPASPSP